MMNIAFKQAHSGNYRRAARGKEDIRYLVLHFTANDGDTAKNNADYFDSGGDFDLSALLCGRKRGLAVGPRRGYRMALRHARRLFPPVLPQREQYRH